MMMAGRKTLMGGKHPVSKVAISGVDSLEVRTWDFQDFKAGVLMFSE